MTVSIALLHPTSRGSIKLASNNPFDAPLIDPGFLTTTFDKVVLREAIKGVRRFLTAPSFSNYVIDALGDLKNATTDALLDELAANGGSTTYHPVSTARMSARGATTGVVDPDLLVKKVRGLRIVDASVLVCATR